MVDSGLGPEVGAESGVQVLQISDFLVASLDELRVAHQGVLPMTMQG